MTFVTFVSEHQWVSVQRSPHPPLQGHVADVPPPPVQTVAGLLDGVALRVAAAGVAIVEQDVAELEHRGDALAVLLDVPLQVLQDADHRVELVPAPAAGCSR